eukprot:4125-Heterococcus_DN1.PRE.10
MQVLWQLRPQATSCAADRALACMQQCVLRQHCRLLHLVRRPDALQAIGIAEVAVAAAEWLLPACACVQANAERNERNYT